MAWVEVARGRLAADVFGQADAEPVLLVAGGGADAWSWVRLVPEVAHDDADREACRPIEPPLSATHRVAVFDQAGVSRSAAVPPARSGPEYAADALAVGRALLGETFAVVGMSLGGIAAQHLALAEPTAVRALVVVASIASAERFVPPPASAMEIPEHLRSYSRRFCEEHPLVLAHIARHQDRVRHHPGGPLAQVSMFLSHEATALLPEVRCPTTVVGAAEDRTFPIENSRLLRDLVPGARLVELADVGHAVHFEAPEAIAAAARAVTP